MPRVAPGTPSAGQGYVQVRREQADRVVKVIEIDDQIVEDALVMLDLASDLSAFLDQGGHGVRSLYHRGLL
jgi:hypothetical protein